MAFVCFGHMLKVLRNTYDRPRDQFWAKTVENPDAARLSRIEWANDKYEQFFGSCQTYVGYYFRHLYNVVKFVDQSGFLKKDAKKRYTNLIRAQLSSDELELLFYNCLSERGAKFKVLVERFALFEDMPSEVLIDEAHRELYDKSAYGESG